MSTDPSILNLDATQRVDAARFAESAQRRREAREASLPPAPDAASAAEDYEAGTLSAALRAHIDAAHEGALFGVGADQAMAIAGALDSPIADLWLSLAPAARRAGLRPRLIIAQETRWSRWRAFDYGGALKALGDENLRLAEFRGAGELLEQAILGFSAQWTGARAVRRGLVTRDGRFDALSSDIEDRRRAALAQARFEAIWKDSRPVAR